MDRFGIPNPRKSGSVIGADRQRFGPSCVLLKRVPQGRTESGGIVLAVLAANAGPRVPRGGVTLKRRCTYRPSVIYLIANKLSNTEREREREREKREGERRVCVSHRRQERVHASYSLCGGCPPRTSPRTCKSARQRSSASSTNIQLVLLGVNTSLSHVHITSSSSSLCSLSRGQEHQTQPPTPVSPIPILLSPLSSVPGYMHHRYMRCTTGLG